MEGKEQVTIHGFRQKPPSSLSGVFVAYDVEGLPWSMYGRWDDHPKLKAVLDLIGGEERQLHTYTIYPDMTQEDFKELVNMDLLVEDHTYFRSNPPQSAGG